MSIKQCVCTVHRGYLDGLLGCFWPHYEPVLSKLGGGVEQGPGKNLLSLGADRDPMVDPGVFKMIH